MDLTRKARTLTDPNRMHQLAMKEIFEGLNDYEKIELYDLGIEAWVKRRDLTPTDKLELNRIINALLADKERDYFGREKEILKKTGLSYWKLYSAGLPYIGLNPHAG